MGVIHLPDAITRGLHGCSREENYIWPEDPLVRRKLEWFQDQKLALMMHFGLYSQLGICESWPLSDGDAEWSRSEIDWEKDPKTFRQQYEGLIRSFNPIRFQPEKWADIAARNGFRYLIFTTKHHDGFCLFDTQLTDYKSTSPDCPFHADPRANIVRCVFDAFRARGLGIAAYFSKPDWHCPWYWAEGMERPVAFDRNPTYDPSCHPEIWEQFVRFTQGQLMELVKEYGPLDILWLDGGQVSPGNGQDIRLSEFMEKARQIQPGLLVSDRTVGGPNENFITPEQSVPDRPVSVPWESCISLGDSFSYRYEPSFKTPREIVHLLINVVCRGGNLALNIAPQPDGRLPEAGVKVLDALGEWLRKNGDAIYGTRMASLPESGAFSFSRKGGTHYALLRLREGETLPPKLLIPWPHPIARLFLVSTGEALPFRLTREGIWAQLPRNEVGTNPFALGFRMEPIASE